MVQWFRLKFSKKNFFPWYLQSSIIFLIEIGWEFFCLTVIFENSHRHLAHFLMYNSVQTWFQLIDGTNRWQTNAKRNTWSSVIIAEPLPKWQIIIIFWNFFRFPLLSSFYYQLSNAILCFIFYSILFDIQTSWKWSGFEKVCIEYSRREFAPCISNWKHTKESSQERDEREKWVHLLLNAHSSEFFKPFLIERNSVRHCWFWVQFPNTISSNPFKILRFLIENRFFLNSWDLSHCTTLITMKIADKIGRKNCRNLDIIAD